MSDLLSSTSGKFFIVATPIGHLKDISTRAIEVLHAVSLIVAEDTRHSKILLKSLAIKTPCVSLHAHNERTQSASLLKKLQAGETLALISDAGTPLISDPGFLLVKLAQELHIPVIPIPGPSALITALSAAGLPCDRFFFAGFLPSKGSARLKELTLFKEVPYTVIFYEAPHRIQGMLKDCLTVLGPLRPLVLAKELTKIHETFITGTIEEALTWLRSDPNHQKGEFVVLLGGVSEKREPSDLKLSHVLEVLLKTLPLMQAVKIATALTGEKKNKVYAQALMQLEIPLM